MVEIDDVYRDKDPRFPSRTVKVILVYLQGDDHGRFKKGETNAMPETAAAETAEKSKTLAAVVKKTVQDIAKENGVNVSGKFYEALDKRVTAIIYHSIDRAKANSRKTLMEQDA